MRQNGDPAEKKSRKKKTREQEAGFLLTAAAVLFSGCALLLFTWLIIKPRFALFSPLIASLAGWIVAGFVACLVLAVVFEALVLTGRKK